MRLLCVIDSLGSGGAQRQLLNVALGLKRRGHLVELFVYYPYAHFREVAEREGLSVRLVEKRSRCSLKPMFNLRRHIRERQFNRVLAFLETPSVYAEMACVGTSSVKLVVSERNVLHARTMSFGRRAKCWLHRLANTVVTNSYFMRDQLMARYPFLRDRLATIWNGVDIEQFHPPVERLFKGELRLLGVGRISRQKNLARLADALNQCCVAGLPVSVAWAGRDDDPEYYRQVLAQTERLSRQGRWHWLGERNDVAALMRSYDAIVLPSLWEGLPNVVCEALASGLPALVSNVSDNARLVQDGTTGFVFDPSSVEAITAAIQRFASLAGEARCRMGEHGRGFAERWLSISSCVTNYESILT